jgi:hypothetical protein
MISRGIVNVVLVATVLGGQFARAQSSAEARGVTITAALEAARGLDPRARTEIVAVLDSARAAGLPTDALAAKVVEGVTKGAAPERIARVVHETYSSMRAAQSILGADLHPGELAAGGGALRAGLGAQDLRRIKTASRDRPSTEALVVATDMLRRGVPASDAVDAVVRLADAGADGEQLLQLQADVAQDVAAGVAPRSAALARARVLSSRPRPQPAPTPAHTPMRPLTSIGANPVQAERSLSADLGFGMWRSPQSNASASLLGLNASQKLSGVHLEGSLAAMRFEERLAESTLRIGVAHLRATSDTLRFGGLRGALAVGLDRDPYDSTFGRAQLALVPTVAVSGRGMLAWISVSPTRSFAREATPSGIESEVGAELTRGGVRLALSALRRRSDQALSILTDSSAIVPSTCQPAPGGRARCLRRASSTSVEGRLSTTLQRVDVVVRGGVLTTMLQSPAKLPTQGWVSLRAGAPLRDNIMLVAQLGSEPPNVVRMLPLRSTFSLGLRIHALERNDLPEQAPAARRAPIEVGPPDVNGERVLRLFAPGTRQVELRGDITAWRSMPLTRGAGGLWELRLRVEPGVYHVVVRYDDGPWQVLTGLPQADDGFDEPTSVLVVGSNETR